LQAVYEQPSYDKAKVRLMSIHKDLSLLNQSAAELDGGIVGDVDAAPA